MHADTPFWKGRLFRSNPVQEIDRETDPDFRRRSDVFGCLLSIKLEALPFPEDIESAVTSRPEAEEDLRRWSDAWERNFPGWMERDYAVRAIEARKRQPAQGSYEHYVSEQIAAFEASTPSATDALTAMRIEKIRMTTSSLIDDLDAHKTGIARTLRAARAFRAGIRLPAFCVAFEVEVDGGYATTIGFVGNDDDDAPLLSHFGANPDNVKCDDVLLSRFIDQTRSRPGPAFWDWPFLLPYLGRTIVGGRADRRELEDVLSLSSNDSERRTRLAGALADLSAQCDGLGHALVSRRDTDHQAATTIPLAGISTIKAAYDLLSTHLPKFKAATVECLTTYRATNRYFVHGGKIVGSSRIDKFGTPYDRDPRRAFDHYLTKGHGYVMAVENQVFDGAFCVAEQDRYAKTVSTMLADNGVFDYYLDIGETHREQPSTSETRDFRVIAVGNLWSADFMTFDPAHLFGDVISEYEQFDTLLEKALDSLSDWPNFGRFSLPFRQVVDLYGRSAMVAYLLSRHTTTWQGIWNDEDVNNALRMALLMFLDTLAWVRDEALTDSERLALEDFCPDMPWDCFHEWLQDAAVSDFLKGLKLAPASPKPHHDESFISSGPAHDTE